MNTIQIGAISVSVIMMMIVNVVITVSVAVVYLLFRSLNVFPLRIPLLLHKVIDTPQMVLLKINNSNLEKKGKRGVNCDSIIIDINVLKLVQ